ncbi:L-alanine-DL-glutamate epimerase [Candidatus Poribacteria bacterium]|nr:L-alanine-DL-glutamate epimerase [Candidatus Poribacteria bacterium]
MTIADVDLEIQREPFARPFGFKGSAFHEKWNAVVRLRSEEGVEAFGVGGFAPLWSDPDVFRAHTEVGGNILMLAILERGMALARECDADSPMDTFDAILPRVEEYARVVTRNPALRRTFTLNALVALDNALWMLHARTEGMSSFDSLVPSTCRPCLGERRKRIAAVPAIGYTLPMESVRDLLDAGTFVLKIKVGHPGDDSEMLDRDQGWLTRLHELTRRYETSMTDCGHPVYYLDANGRYGEKDGMRRLLDHAAKIDMLDRIILVEEPFDEAFDFDVGDLPSRFAADESLHTPADVAVRAQQGYAAMAIKPAGKTLSMGFGMIEATHEAGAIPFVADNACVPWLVDWNKVVAARLPAFPGVRAGMMETNGPQNYATWETLLASVPHAEASWLKPDCGAFVLDDEFYHRSAGMFADPTPYSDLFR